MKKAAVIGAGRTGRGFIGRLLSEAGCEILFVDKNEELVRRLNEQKSFQVRFFGNVREEWKVEGYTASTWEQADFSDIELLLVSVGGTNLEDVGSELKNRLKDGKLRYLITAENARHPAQILKNAIGPDVNVAEATVFCTTVEENGLNIRSENYPYLQYDVDTLGYRSDMAQLKPVKGFHNFLTRKLYTYNAASCIIAYLGYMKGYSDYGEAANDSEILELLDRNYSETNAVLCRAFGYAAEDQAEFAALSRTKFCDRTIADTVARNAREPQRKLQKGERILGPLLLLDEYGADGSVLVLTAAAMLLYRAEEEKEWARITASNTPEQILENIAGLEPGSALFRAILDKREELLDFRKNGGRLPV